MPTMQDVKGKRVTVAGLGRFGGGIAVSRWLVEQGARVLVTDRDSEQKLASSVAQLAGLPIEFHLGEHRISDFTDTDVVVTSPAIPPSSEYLQAATGAGVPVTTEIRLFVERCSAPIIGITGTKGKSTTTALLGRMIDTRFKTWVGGNIGRSLLVDLPRIGVDDVVVLELSSFMLQHLAASRWSPHLAVVTMLSTDHVEWHGSAEAYMDAKVNIVRFQNDRDIAVLNRNDPAAQPFIEAAQSKIIDYGSEHRPIDLKLPGSHNQLNAQAALAAAMAMGISVGDAEASVSEFAGLPHRLQVIHESKGVSWVNDSIATIPEAGAAALSSFPPGKVIQIVGGSDKHLPMDTLVQALAERAKSVVCIGQTGPAIASAVRNIGEACAAKVHDCGDLSSAVSMARSLAQRGDIVLLSTGCASYDQFENFEKRGEMFTQLARAEPKLPK